MHVQACRDVRLALGGVESIEFDAADIALHIHILNLQHTVSYIDFGCSRANLQRGVIHPFGRQSYGTAEILWHHDSLHLSCRTVVHHIAQGIHHEIARLNVYVAIGCALLHRNQQLIQIQAFGMDVEVEFQGSAAPDETPEPTHRAGKVNIRGATVDTAGSDLRIIIVQGDVQGVQRSAQWQGDTSEAFSSDTSPPGCQRFRRATKEESSETFKSL